ncbi:MAG TPA: NfeD family protein [Gemmatimonadales bacterium]|jgi:membrane protein implicated in regulation of membrane protease activity|nr:NfeD family protein [Gemmatimonadales bacterium]
MSGWQIWTIIGVLLLVAEMFAPGFWLACVAIGCFVAGLAGLAPVGLTGQVIAFAVSTLASLVGIRPFLRRHFRLEPGTGVRTNVDALLGKTGVVTERIDAGGGAGGVGARSGRVIVEGENWRGASVDGAVLEPGTRVMVVQVDGTTLMVEREPES